jgi:hypothetical protein
MKKKIIVTPKKRSHHTKAPAVSSKRPPSLEAERSRLAGVRLGMGGDTDTIDLQIAEIEKKINESQG